MCAYVRSYTESTLVFLIPVECCPRVEHAGMDRGENVKLHNCLLKGSELCIVEWESTCVCVCVYVWHTDVMAYPPRCVLDGALVFQSQLIT